MPSKAVPSTVYWAYLGSSEDPDSAKTMYKSVYKLVYSSILQLKYHTPLVPESFQQAYDPQHLSSLLEL